MTKIIHINSKHGNVLVLIDAEDSHLFDLHKYYCYWSSSNNQWCVRRHQNYKQIFLHNDILPKQEGCVLDHINGNPLDNRKQNLRYADLTQNQANRKRNLKKKSGLPKNVFEAVKNGRVRYRVMIAMHKKLKHYGYYSTIEEAGKVAKEKANELFGEFSLYNSRVECG